MNRYDILKKAQDMAAHNLLCYSKTYGMDTPKDGQEAEWQSAKEELEIIDGMIAELPHRVNGEEMRVYKGVVSSHSVMPTFDGGSYVDTVELSIDCGDDYNVLLRIDRETGEEWFINGRYDTERHARYAEGKSAKIRVYVDSINYIRKVEFTD